MIRLPTKADFRVLASSRDPNSLTIYAPYIVSDSTNNPNRIQFKDTVKEATNLLQSKNLRQQDISKILHPIKQLLDSDEFQIRYPHSLAIFSNKDIYAQYYLPPEDIEYFVGVNHGFNLQQLAKLIQDDFKYYILMLSYNGVSLFSGDKYNIRKLKFQKTPKTMLQELNIDEFPNERQLHTVGPPAEGHKAERYHGQYNPTQTNKNMLTNFFRRIDKKVNHHIKFKDRPLILAGVDYLLPLYKKVSTYHRLFTKSITGNFEHDSPDRLRAKACALLTK